MFDGDAPSQAEFSNSLACNNKRKERELKWARSSFRFDL